MRESEDQGFLRLTIEPREVNLRYSRGQRKTKQEVAEDGRQQFEKEVLEVVSGIRNKDF